VIFRPCKDVLPLQPVLVVGEIGLGPTARGDAVLAGPIGSPIRLGCKPRLDVLLRSARL
jgi:hypothetical protein